MFIIVGASFVLAVALTVFMAYFATSYSLRTSAYDSAPSCSSTSDQSGCRFQGPALVVHQYTDNGDPAVDLTFIQLGAETFPALVNQSYTPQWQTWSQGSTVTAELWQGVVTKVQGLRTRGNPDALPRGGILAVEVFGATSLACVGIFVWLLSLNRNAGRGPESPRRIQG